MASCSFLCSAVYMLVLNVLMTYVRPMRSASMRSGGQCSATYSSRFSRARPRYWEAYCSRSWKKKSGWKKMNGCLQSLMLCFWFKHFISTKEEMGLDKEKSYICLFLTQHIYNKTRTKYLKHLHIHSLLFPRMTLLQYNNTLLTKILLQYLDIRIWYYVVLNICKV